MRRNGPSAACRRAPPGGANFCRRSGRSGFSLMPERNRALSALPRRSACSPPRCLRKRPTLPAGLPTASCGFRLGAACSWAACARRCRPLLPMRPPLWVLSSILPIGALRSLPASARRFAPKRACPPWPRPRIWLLRFLPAPGLCISPAARKAVPLLPFPRWCGGKAKLSPLNRLQHLGRGEGHRTYPHADGIEDGIGNRGRNHRRRGLAGSPRLLPRAVDQVDLHLGNFREGEDRVTRPIEAGDVRAIERHLLFQRAADGHQHIALDLVAQPVGVDDLPAIMRDIKPADADLAAAAVDFDIGNRADIRAHELVFDIGKPAPGGDFCGSLPR